MGRHSKVKIKESIEELKILYKTQSNSRLKLRLKCLIYTKQKKYKTQAILATHLGIDYSSLKRWLKQYMEEGLESYIAIKSKRNKPSIITREIHNQIADKLNSSASPFRGYWEAQQWINSNFDLEMNYNTVRTYLIRHFKTKIKTLRKSHYKKNDQAIESFLKTTKYAKRNQS